MRPRYQITETPAVAHAIDLAARRWPGESRSRLLLRLVTAAGAALEEGEALRERERREALAGSSGKYTDAFGPNYLGELRRDWPA